MNSIQVKTPSIRTERLDLFLNKLIESFNSNNLELFLSIHSFNDVFFKVEQIRWFQDILTDEHAITKIEVSETDNFDKLKINFLTKNSFGERRENHVTYRLKLHDKQLVITSLDVQTMTSLRRFSISYSPSMRMEVSVIEEIVSEIISFFYKRLNVRLNPEDIHIILFDTPVSLASSIPTDHAYGWYEHLESIKILIPDFIEDKQTYLRKILSHEMTHLFLSKISNDNLALYFQEGVALYIENSFINQYDYYPGTNLQKKQVYDSLEILKEFNSSLMTFDQLNNLRAEHGVEIYHQGYLWTNYLISKYGLHLFLEFIESLCLNVYVNKRCLNKIDINNKLTSEQIDNFFPKIKFQELKDFYLIN
ncbi:hypothetical protein [Exiguobacterium sp. S22-S28]|uniref:hypothetical protein n=1 Tax=Exiguobacterium sp. S22-S28 TaxID=3342768 RepID=UPI00372D82A3